MTTAFVLSGGGSLAAVQIGMLAALADRGIRPDLLVGTSAGALNAAFVAGHGADPSAIAELGRVWQSVRSGQLFHLQPQRALLALIGRRSSVFSPDGLDELILTVLSQSTNDRNRDVAYLALRRDFEDWAAVRDAPNAAVERSIRPGGISKVKSARIQDILRAIDIETFDADLERMPVDEAREVLVGLPGVGR